MRKHLALASATLAALSITVLVGSTSAHAQADPASRAIQYLAAQQGADGSIAGAPGATEDAIIGTASAGYDPSTLVASSGKSVFDYLTASVQSGKADATAGATGKLILALVASHRDPHSFAGVDLVARLQSQYTAGTGNFDDASANVFSQSLGILAEVASGVSVPAKAVTQLTGAQRADGGWGYDTTASTTSSDTNSTAIALQGLSSAGTHAADAKALNWLHGVQKTDGGFGFDASSPSDPDSDATVLQALIAAGQDPSSASWTVGGHTVIGSLLGFLDATSGGATFPGNPGPDAFTTSEVPAAIERLPYGGATVFIVGSSAASQDASAVHALRCLLSQQGADGSIAGAPGATEDAIIGTASAGYDPSTLVASSGKSVFDYLTASVQSGKADATAGATGKLILALVASHRDPHSFAGVDLVARLQSQYTAGTGNFDDASANVFSQSLGILAEVASGASVPAKAVTQLSGAQRADGGWGYDTTASTTSSDTNSTAIALQGLSSAGTHTADAKALNWLHGVQKTDGGFGFDASSPSDPDSDATVLQALIAAGQDPSSASWTVGGHTVIGSLLGFLDASSGGATFPGNPGPDAFTTSEVPAAIERLPYGGVTRFTAGRALVAPPTPTPTPAATPAATAAPATPTAAPVVQSAVGAPSTGGGPALTDVSPAAPGGAGVAAMVAAMVMAAAGALGSRRRVWRRRAAQRLGT